MKSLIAVIALFLIGCSVNSDNPVIEKPNVLFIAVDDLNDWIGPLGGYEGVKTPNLDRLAERSTLFTNAHCAAPACNPSRAAVMTGVAPYKSGVYYNPQPWRESPVLKDIQTLPQYLRENGYKVMGAGKIFHGSYPDSASWDYYWPSQKRNRPPDPKPDKRPLNNIPETGNFDWGSLNAKFEDMSDFKVAQWTVSELNKDHDKPFFLACGLFRPHLPWFVPQKYFDLYPLDEINLPIVKKDDLEDIPPIGRKLARINDHENVTKYDQWKEAVQAYLASITFVDQCIGEVLDALEKSSYKDNTLVVLWSDHGWHLGEKLSWRKFTLWEEATRNVLMFDIPWINDDARMTKIPASLLDIYPTVVEACGIDIPNYLDGKSLYSTINGYEPKKIMPVITTYGKGNHSVRAIDWRYTRYEDGSEELYNHSTDNMEWKNLAYDPSFDSIKLGLSKFLPLYDADYSPFEKGKERNYIKN